MPTWRTVLRYENTLSGLQWNLTNYISAASPAACFALADPFNTAYLTICTDVVNIVDYRCSDVTVYRDEFVKPGSQFTTPAGLVAGLAMPDAEAALWTGFGTNVTQGQSKWWMHGIDRTYNSPAPDGFPTGVANVIALNAAAFAYFKQYRPGPVGPAALPLVVPPAAFGSSSFGTTLHVRRLGRPFLSNGQTRRYSRT